MIFDYHTHTTFSHGKGSIEDNVKAAAEAGLSALAITDHGPGHLTYGVKRSDFSVMRDEIERLKPLYPQVDIYLGVEANIVSVRNYLDVTEEETAGFDFILAGYHYGIPHGYCVSNWLDAHGLLPGCGTSLLVKNTDMTLKALYENDIKILNVDFEDSVKDDQKGDFIYFDPPYDSETSIFNSYTENGFGKGEQKRLAEVYKKLADKGCYVMLSNHNTTLVRELYKDFNIHVIEAKRNINANGSKRGKVEEVIITNYENERGFEK